MPLGLGLGVTLNDFSATEIAGGGGDTPSTAILFNGFAILFNGQNLTFN